MTMSNELLLYGTVDSDKENILVLFKHHQRWNPHTLHLLAREYNVYHTYFRPLYEKYDTKQLQSQLNDLQKKFKFVSLLVDVEWGEYFSIVTVDLFEEVLPVGLMLFDDGTMHDYNQVLAARASFVITGCPIGHFKYLEADIPSANAILAICSEVYGCNPAVPEKMDSPVGSKEIELLWFGFADKADRKAYINAIGQRFPNLKFLVYQGEQVGNITMSGDLSWTDLGALIQRSGCVLNLTQSDFPIRTYLDNLLPRPFQRIATGRAIEAGLLGAWCISEYSPGYILWGLEGLMPMFRTQEECVALVDEHVANPRQSHNLRQEFVQHIRSRFSDEATSRAVRSVIEEGGRRTSRMVSRVSPIYTQNMINRLNAWLQGHPARLQLELALLEKSVSKTNWNFQSVDLPVGNYYKQVIRN